MYVKRLHTLAALLGILGAGSTAQERAVGQTGPVTATQRLEAFQTHAAMADGSFFGTLPWQFLGPTNFGGRITDVVVAQPRGRTYTMYVGGASGGVWKTDNEGVTWTPVFEDQVTTSIGDLALAPSDQDIVWVGTGEANIFRSSHAGAGIWKSTDGGETWAHMGLTETQTIARIVVHPTDPNTVWVAASGHEWTDNPERGVFKTTDGGRTWNRVLYVDEKTGAIDLVIHPEDPTTLYAATWQRVRKKWNDPRNEPDYGGSGVWKSTDGGETWSAVNNGLPDPRYRGRIGIDIARSRPETLYAFVDNYEIAREADPDAALDAYGRPRGGIIRGATVFRSDDAGTSWRRVSEYDDYMENLSGTYGWVFGQMRVDPNDPETVYVMGLALNVSHDGGRTFQRLSGMHGDHHGLWIDPANSDYLVNNNDGGAYVSYDGGESWRSFTDKLPMVQFFNVNYDMDDPFHVFGSVQDHGSYRGVVDLSGGRQAIPAVEWEGAPGGEGSHHAVDPTDPAIVYSAGFYGTISRTNIDTGERATIVPRAPEGEPPYRGQWLAPFIVSPHNPRIIYHGMNHVFRSWDRGDAWERISPDLSRNLVDELGDIPYQTVTALSESPVTFGLLYAGTDDGRVHVTRDGGGTWTDISGGLQPDRFTSRIVASAYEEGRVYLTQNGKRSDDFAAYVWTSDDFGRTWRSIAGDLPFGPVNVIREDPRNPDLLYVGTDVSAYVSLDRGGTWHALSHELPSTFVHDLVVHPRDDILVAATHGRGMYAFDVRQLQKLTTPILAEAVHLFEPEHGTLPGGGGFGGGFGAPSGQSAWVHYWLADEAAVTAVVKDLDGQVVATLAPSGRAGLQQVEWNLERDSAEAAEGQGFRRRRNFVAPGNYTVELTVDGTVHPVPVRVGR
jgi:photosystem II stability/assembly factor-like uncharacterized protein